MKRRSIILAICCMLSLLILSACSHSAQSQTQSPGDLEATAEETSSGGILLQKNLIVRYPLADSEIEEIARQSQFLQDAGIEDMTEETADVLAEYFVRCHRLDIPKPSSDIVDARHEIVPTGQESLMPNLEYWILTLSDGTEYWLSGFSVKSFSVNFVHRDGPDGELLYGFYR